VPGGTSHGLASYRIFGVPGAWHVDHDGKAANTYETKEAAFEAPWSPRPSPCGKGTKSALPHREAMGSRRRPEPGTSSKPVQVRRS